MFNTPYERFIQSELNISKYILDEKLPYDPICPSVGWLVGRSFVLSVGLS